MLGLGSSLSKTGKKSTFSPLRIKDLVGWWDFSDPKYIYSDAGATKVTHGDGIQQVNNKAFHLQSNRQTALGTHFYQATSGNRPLWNSQGYAYFDGSDDYLVCNNVTGNVATDKLSDTTLNATGMTIFYVINSLDGGSGVSSDQVLFHAQTTDNAAHRFSVVIDDDSTNDQWGYVIQDNAARTILENRSGRSIKDGMESWTIHLDSTSASSIYADGQPALGIVNGTSSNTDYDFSENENNIGIFIGGKASNDSANIHVYQVLIYDRALDTKEIQLVNRYLNSRNQIF